jgi:hypothetical protein
LLTEQGNDFGDVVMVNLRVLRFAGFDCERFLQHIRVFERRFTLGAGRDLLGFPARYRIPHRFDRNTYDATFWFKRSTDKIVCGMNPGPLSDEMKHKLERNSGVVALGVVLGAPAFQANILKSDIILNVDDEDIIDPSTFTAQVTKYAGRRVNFQIPRDGIPRPIPVELRPSLTP